MEFAQYLEQFETTTPSVWWLPEGRSLWLIEEGAVDVFVTGIRDGQPVGPRRPLFRVFGGKALMSVDPMVTQADEALLVVPLPQTLVRQIPLDALKQLGVLRDARKSIVSLVASWIDIITRGLPPPKDYQPLRADAPFALKRGQVACAVERHLWAKLVGGAAAYMGEEDLLISQQSPALPLHLDVWIRAQEDLTVVNFDPLDLFESGEFWLGVTMYQEIAIRHALRVLERMNQVETSRLQVKAEHDSRVMHEVLARFVNVVQGEWEASPELLDDPLLAACQMIGQHMNIAFQAPPRHSQPGAGSDPLLMIAEASAVRMRQVALRGEWWWDDNGPLLAFQGEARAPVALLPVKNRSYQLHDPASGDTRRVTPEVAQTLAPFATQFYRSFPPKTIKLIDLFQYAVPGLWGEIVAIIALGSLGGLIGMAIPVATGRMVDSVIPSADRKDAITLMLVLIAVTLGAEIFEMVRSIAVLRMEGKMNGSIQAAIWDRVLALSPPFFRKYAAGDLADRINGINVIRHTLSATTVEMLLSSAFSLFSFFLLLYYSAKLAGIAVLLTAVAVAATLVIGWLKLRYERQLAELSGSLSGTVFQYLLGIVKLRVAAAENRAFAIWAREFTRLRSLSFKAQKIAAIHHTFFAGYSVIVNAVVFAVIGMFLMKQTDARLSTGDFVAFNAAFGSFFSGLVGITEVLLKLLNLVPTYERSKPILTSLPEVDASKEHPGSLRGLIEVVKLGFSYDGGPEILKEVTFAVQPGEFIALVGPSGSGKSTLLRLMLGFEKPTCGSIYYDNQDLADIDVRAVRRQIGVVLQGGQLVTGDILTNIVGTSSLTIDDAWEAARMVGLEDDINKMPMGMYTVISEGSSTLSGGQRQRILIARAIVHRPRILIFDEATSALDNLTQAIVSRSLEQLKATRIVIAHRLSTVINADRIIVLDNGTIVQTGIYQTLLSQPGPFAELAKRQIA